MVHKVIPEIDAGEVVLTQKVPIYPEDTIEQLEQRMHESEHKIIVDSINKVLG
jgi:folate-dependent phosphoribosylglycinamide formyltransferase PurN